MKKSNGFKYIGILALSAGMSVGCAQMGQKSAEAEVSPAAASAIAEAEKAIGKAKRLDWVWRDTGKILKKAKKAAQAGKDEQAIKLAKEAKIQAQLAVEQYYTEQKMDRSQRVVEVAK